MNEGRLNPGDIVRSRRLVGMVVGKVFGDSPRFAVLTIIDFCGSGYSRPEISCKLAAPEEVILYTVRMMDNRGKREPDRV
jgi:hypothetical protein